MSNIDIQVLYTQEKQGTSKTGKTYQILEVTFKNLTMGGKAESKQLFDFVVDKSMWKTLVESKPGDTFTIEREKDKREGKYWDWVGIARQDNPPADSPAPAFIVNKTAPRSNYETPEERAIKQRYIIRQSCLNVAVQITPGSPPEAVVKMAKEFEDYVLSPFDTPTPAAISVGDMSDDIPF
ncbi:hypothetical protein SDC9_141580 [bioreactor metagenome]|uniref:Uncharacterized protein n=1 Tax=bioreactor metagenome TaxID=1076179 RepID=A0A645DY26_9ZZZZ